MSELGLARGRLIFEPLGPDSDAEPINRLLIFAPEESLFFANADTVRVHITNRLAACAEPVDSVVLDLELTNEPDVPSAEMLKDLHNDLDAAGVQPLLARGARRCATYGPQRRTATIGQENFYRRVSLGVSAHLSRIGSHAELSLGLSGATLKMLQQAINEMLAHAEDPHRAQLAALNSELGAAISTKPKGARPGMTKSALESGNRMKAIARWHPTH